MLHNSECALYEYTATRSTPCLFCGSKLDCTGLLYFNTWSITKYSSGDRLFQDITLFTTCFDAGASLPTIFAFKTYIPLCISYRGLFSRVLSYRFYFGAVVHTKNSSHLVIGSSPLYSIDWIVWANWGFRNRLATCPGFAHLNSLMSVFILLVYDGLECTRWCVEKTAKWNWNRPHKIVTAVNDLDCGDGGICRYASDWWTFEELRLRGVHFT